MESPGISLTFTFPHRRRFFYPISTMGKIVERLHPENAARGVPRQNKRGETVHEIPHDAIAGYVLAFSVLPPTARIHDPQYQLVLADPDDAATEGYISFGQNTSLGRQLVNQLLSLTPSMLAGIITLTLRTASRPPSDEAFSSREFRANVYLNLYRERHPFYNCLVPRRFSRDEIPPPRQSPDGKWDFTAANVFFHRHALEFTDHLRELMPRLSVLRTRLSSRSSTGTAPDSDGDAGRKHIVTRQGGREDSSILEDVIPF